MINRTPRFARRILALALATLSVTAIAGPTGEEMQAHLAARYPSTPFQNVKAAPIDGLYEVTMGENVAYTDASGDYFLFGHLFDMKNQVDLTAESQAAGIKTRFPAQFLDHAIKTVRGNGKRVVAVFADPDCPYCHELEKEMLKVDNITVYTFLYPLESLHPDAMTKSIRIQCAPNPSKSWQDWMFKGQLPPLVSCHHPINDNVVLGTRLGVSGTPTLIAEDGRVLPGAVSAAQLEAWLNAGQTTSTADVKQDVGYPNAADGATQ